ncbi:MAG: hypothetical protein HYU71_10815 [Bacteroidetes bacterium]|nr:hypothetical protein [Bacteroidota bacterium]
MIVEFIPIFIDEFERVQYYTVRLEGRAVSEFKDFQTRLGKNAEDRVELSEINRYIEKIGNEYGAYPEHFRHEEAAEALPPGYHTFIETDNYNDYGLRLYCIRLCPSVVILLNGDRKVNQKAQRCPNCRPHFEKASIISKAINRAIVDGYMRVVDEKMELEIDGDFELEI